MEVSPLAQHHSPDGTAKLPPDGNDPLRYKRRWLALEEVLFQLPYKIGLDTGLVYGNTLSCLETTEKVLYQITRGAKPVRRISVKGRWEKLESTPVP